MDVEASVRTRKLPKGGFGPSRVCVSCHPPHGARVVRFHVALQHALDVHNVRFPTDRDGNLEKGGVCGKVTEKQHTVSRMAQGEPERSTQQSHCSTFQCSNFGLTLALVRVFDGCGVL